MHMHMHMHMHMQMHMHMCMPVLASRSNSKSSAAQFACSATFVPKSTDAVFNARQWVLNDNGERHETTFSVSRYRALTIALPIILGAIDL